MEEIIVFDVHGMTCDGCVRSVTRVLSAFEGVSNVEVALQRATARVSADPLKVNAEQLKAAVRAAGFETS